MTRMWQEPLSGHQPSPWASPPLVPTTRPRGAIPVLMTDYGLSTGSGGLCTRSPASCRLSQVSGAQSAGCVACRMIQNLWSPNEGVTARAKP